MTGEWALTPEQHELLYQKFKREQREFAAGELAAIRSPKFRLSAFARDIPKHSRIEAYRKGFEDAYHSLGIHPEQEDQS